MSTKRKLEHYNIRKHKLLVKNCYKRQRKTFYTNKIINLSKYIIIIKKVPQATEPPNISSKYVHESRYQYQKSRNQNSWNVVKAVFRGKFIGLSACIRKEDQKSII